MRRTLIATLVAGVWGSAMAMDMESMEAALKRMGERIEALERHNKALEDALSSERISEKEPEIATRLKYTESQVETMRTPATKLAEALEGVKVSGAVVAVAQNVNADGTSTGMQESRNNYRGDLTVTMPLGSMGDNDGQFFTHVRFGQGEGVGLRTAYTSGVNSTAFQTSAGADDSFAILAQAWYQLKIPLNEGVRKADARNNLYLTVGKVDPFGFFDQNAIADDESSRFLNNAFVHNPLLDSGGDIGADNYGFMPGAIAKYEDSSEKGAEWSLSLGALSSGAGANFSGSGQASLLIAQAERNTRIAYLPGTWRVYAWSNSRAQDYSSNTQTATGWGLSLNQKVSEGLTLFCRYGQHLNGLVKFDRALAIGAELEGHLWNRSADSIGLAMGSLSTSDAYRTDAPTVSGYQAADNERLTELYYPEYFTSVGKNEDGILVLSRVAIGI